MVKKIIFGVLLVALMGVLFYGAALRTAEKTGAEETAGGGQGRGRAEQTPAGAGVVESRAVQWVTLDGRISEVNVTRLVVVTADGKSVLVANRAWKMAQTELKVAPGDAVSLLGFYEGENFEVGKIMVKTTGQVVAVRDQNGYPLWSGKGRSW